MLVKWGALVVAGRGGAGGTIASRSAFGNYFRNKAFPINKQTPYQELIRQRIAEVTQSWKELTYDERKTWLVQDPSTVHINVFGDKNMLYGFSLYCKINLNLLNIGEEKRKGRGKARRAARKFLKRHIRINNEPWGIIVTQDTPIDEETKVILFATAPMSPGITNPGSTYRQIAILDSTDVSPIDITADYTTKFGENNVLGQLVYFKFVMVEIESGLAYPGETVSTLIVEPLPP